MDWNQRAREMLEVIPSGCPHGAWCRAMCQSCLAALAAEAYQAGQKDKPVQDHAGCHAECWYCMKPGFLYRHDGGYNIAMCDRCRGDGAFDAGRAAGVAEERERCASLALAAFASVDARGRQSHPQRHKWEAGRKIANLIRGIAAIRAGRGE